MDRVGRDRCFWGAILLVLLLLATSPPPTPSLPEDGASPPWEDYGRLVNLEEAPPLTAFLLRVLSIAFLTLLLSGAAINLQGMLRRDWRVFSPGDPPRVPWGVGPVLKLAVYFFALFLLVVRLERILLGLAGIPPVTVAAWLLLANAYFQFALLLGLTWWFLRSYRTGPEPDLSGRPGTGLPRWKFLSLSPGEWLRRARQALRGYICFFPGLVVLGLLGWWFSRIFGLPGQVHPLVEPILEDGRPGLVGPLLVVGVLFAPLAEEIFFRGLLFPALGKKAGVFWAAVITAALFATLHFNWVGWLPIFGLGMLLARGYQRTGSLLVPIIIHGLHNALFLSFSILVYRAT